MVPRILAITAALSAFSLLIAHLYGRALHLANPNGILQDTPSLNEELLRDPAYPLGFMLGGGGTALCVFFAALSLFLSSRFFWPKVRPLATQILIASLISGLVVFAATFIVELNHVTPQAAQGV